jgi:ankyrin repeat protein
MGSDTEASSRKIVEAFERATKEFNLCPNRVWAVARESLPELLPDSKTIPGHETHELCTFDFCEFAQRDFTAIKQRHECIEQECVRLQGPFSRDILKEAAESGKSTVWSLDGKSMIEPPRPYMAISHVWSDGTGTGAWPEGEVNKCLYAFFRGIANQFQCDGIWWDTVCIPREKAARTRAIQKIQSNYQDARITLVHDCFLRNWEWVDAEAACFAILMSPWFSRGWTALELSKSHKVKVVFKGPCGPLIKDLDEQILAKDTQPSSPYKKATDIIRNLRKEITTLNDLLTALGSRYTSWPKDLAIISGLLVGVEVAPEDPRLDIWQQDIYKRILRKLGKVSSRHLFHDSATMSKVSWCPTSLFAMPIAYSEPSLNVVDDDDLIGTWKLIHVNDTLKEKCVWNGTHPLIREELQHVLKDPDKCVLLAECSAKSNPVSGIEWVDRALLAKAMEKKGMSGTLCCQYAGALYFHPVMLKEYIDKEESSIEMEVRLLGDTTNEKAKPAGNAWELVKKLERARNGELPRHAHSDKTMGGEIKTSSNAQAVKGENNQAYSDSETHPLILAASRGDKMAVQVLLKTSDPNVKEPVSQRTALHYATWRRRHDVFLELIEYADPNVPDVLRQQPLHLAAERGDKEIVLSLLDKAKRSDSWDVTLGARCKFGKTALHYAAWGGSAAVVDLLLKSGSNANTEDNDGNIALHLAAEKGFERAVTILIEKSDLNVKNQNGVTPLHHAAMNGHEAVVQLLLGNGVDIAAKDKRIGWTPLHCAAETGHEAVVKLLLDKDANVNAKDGIDWTPLHCAAVKGHKAVVKMLVDNDANVNAKDKEGWTPLRFAAENGQDAVVKLLEGNGADVKAKDSDIGWTPLHCIAMKGQEAVANLLVNNSANVNFKDEDRRTPLWWAAENGQDAVVKLLVDKGANVNEKDKHGKTPLHCAAEKGDEAVVKLLLDKSAEVNTYDNNHETPLHYAAENGDDAVVKLLLDKSAEVNTYDNDHETPLHYAAEKGYKAVVKQLLEKSANVAEKSKAQGRTPLHYAASKGHEAVVNQLLDKGADVEAHDHQMARPLHLAAIGGHETLVKLLLDKGAKVNSEYYEYWTALHYAIERGHERVVELLLNYGADVNKWAFDGWTEKFMTPLHFAERSGQKAIVKLLVDNGANINEKEREQI